MVFSSIIFLLYFLPAFLFCYHMAGERQKNLVILIFSLVFYSWGAPKFVFVLLLLTGIDFFVVKKNVSFGSKADTAILACNFDLH